MTYSSPTVRFLYHQLPAADQLLFSDLEDRLAKLEKLLHIDGVMSFDGASEVIFRISFEQHADATTGNGRSSG